MSDEQNTEKASEQTSAEVQPKAADAAPTDAASPRADASAGEPAPKPRRRARKADAKAESDAPAEEAAGAKTDAAAAEGEAKKAPARRTRARKSDAAAPARPAESAEVIQARALAQISQASVVRRQRRAAERAAEMIAAPGDAASVASAPAANEEKAARKAVKEAAPAAAAPAAADAKEVAPAPAPAVPAIPFVDPALRPHRRGRKPKAYVEAEKAAAAALAAAQAAAQGGAASAPAAEAPESKAAEPKADVRPGRGARAKREDAAKTAPAAEAKPEARDQDAAAEEHQEQRFERQNRRQHQSRRNEGGAQGNQGDRGDRNQNHGGDRNDRRNNRQRNDRNNKRNNRFAPVEPSLSREELAAMKVAELRDKAKELDLDTAGKKKAELVEEIYAAAARAEGFREIEGILDITNEGFGYIRAHGYMPSRDDAFVAANMIRAAGLRAGDVIAGTLRPSRANDKYPGLAKLRSVNGMDPEDVKRRPKFADLTPIYPNEPLKMEHGKESITGRAIDIVSPIGKGQRGLIVSPPKAGKTTILKKICQSISANNPEVHLICLLVDERPEEVTDMQRSIKGDVVASTFDMPADNHTRVSELVIERAKRIVEMGGDVVVVLDSITRLARAYNLAAPASGRILSGGVDSAALYPPKRFLGAARNIENGGSLTILASALVDTGSKMDEVIFEEFKGTGNMELKLDRDLADRRIFPAIDPVASGTRNEDLLVDANMRPFVWGIRRILANMNNTERAAASFIKGLKGTNSNQEFLIRTAKKAADHEASL